MPFSIVPRHRLLSWISECTGDTIWPLDHCQRRGVPPDWIERLSDAFESSFDRDSDTIYFDEHRINQFHGLRDVDLAQVIAVQLGLDLARLKAQSFSRTDLVRRIHEAIEEG
jgi:hypothetical protein